MNLLPTSALAYNEYWKSIKNYNSLFIRLRFIAVGFLALFVVGISLLFQLTQLQFITSVGITLIILLYNISFSNFQSRIQKDAKYHHVKFSLVQIILDLISLSALVYITGVIETPIFMFYIFHMIIGAIILPASIIYSIAGVLIFGFSLFSFLEYAGIIVHQSIKGLYPFSFYNELNFVVAFVLFFS